MNYRRGAQDIVDVFACVCIACGRKPSVSALENPCCDELDIRAYCHGSNERLAVDLNLFAADLESEGNRIRRWCENLFAFDAFPDMRELLAYNRGRLPEARK